MTKIKTISTQQLINKLADENVKVINVLEEKYYKDCHIKGSINIPHDKLLEQTASWDKDQEIIVYCANNECQKSKRSYDLLIDIGFKNVFDYPGGIKEWFQSGQERDGNCSLDYIHKQGL